MNTNDFLQQKKKKNASLYYTNIHKPQQQYNNIKPHNIELTYIHTYTNIYTHIRTCTHLNSFT